MEKKIFLISQLENCFICFTGFKRSFTFDSSSILFLGEKIKLK